MLAWINGAQAQVAFQGAEGFFHEDRLHASTEKSRCLIFLVDKPAQLSYCSMTVKDGHDFSD
jgi:hypothetical protein